MIPASALHNRYLLPLAIGLALFLQDHPRAVAQGYPAEEAPGHMQVPAGLEVQLLAAEPLVRQPVALEYDDRGRAWVVQYLQYPNPAGLKRAKVDRYSRTTYDRVPEPPPRGPKGDDRLTILTDDNGDGRADRATDFASGLNLASGLAFGHGGVFVLQVPYLLFYPDRDGDDRSDGEPDVLLTGFGMEDAHSVANSLTWGPDGWLYGCQGSTVTSNIRGIEFQQGVWRYHPLSHRFELFCEGGGNSWGLDFDAHGNLFYSTNFGGYAMLHGVQGAYYWKQFGKHGALHNPYAYGYFDHVPHRDLKGGHVTVGGLIYQGDSLGEAFRNRYIAADLLGHAMYWHDLEPRGSTFSAQLAGDFLLSGDTWFAPSDVTQAPDGAIVVCDWHDQRTGHPDPDADWDRSNGRVYRIQAKGYQPRPLPEFANLETAKLIGLLRDKNDWIVRRARRVLADRRDPEAILPLRTLIQTAGDDHLALEALWALYVSGGLSDEFAMTLLAHPSADIRWWTVRLVGDDEHVAPAVASRLARIAERETSVAVRVQLAATAKRLAAHQALPIITALMLHDEDAADPYQPLMLWWAVERHAVAAREETVIFFTRPAFQKAALVRGTILERLLRRYVAEATTDGYLAAARILESAPQERDRLLAALDQGLRDRTTVRGGSAGTLYANLASPSAAGTSVSPPQQASLADIPQPLLDQIDQAWSDDTNNLTLIRLAARLNRPAAVKRALAILSDHNSPLAARIEAAQIVAEARAANPKLTEVVPTLFALLASDQPPTLRQSAIGALAQIDDETIARSLLGKLPALDEPLRAKAIDALLGRRTWALLLLEAIDRDELSAKEIAVDQLRGVAQHQDARLDGLVKKHWGAIQGGTPEERLAEMRRINNDLRAARGNPPDGKLLFTKHCGTCHQLFGEGNAIGPELTHANRKNTDELLATIVSPSAVIRKEFMSFVVQTTDGRVLTGLLVEQTPGSITLLGAKNERTTVPRSDVEAIRESPVSLMPDNLLHELKPQELRDLFSYLQSDSPASATK